MKQNCNVPAFLSKLWTLVEDADTNEFICWSQEGNSFLVLDEQRFAKEILPKFFKHNNMASFIRQLNMYGFRKVMHIDAGVVKQERDGPVEFQHPYFKHGQDELLEHIKRKVSNARPEDGKIRQDDLSKILAGVQTVHSMQESIDARLVTLKRENETLWREISDLRQKHAHQQQLIKKLIQFIVTLVQNNRILNLKRKRPILMNSSGKKPKYIHQLYEDKVCVDQSSVNGLNAVKNSEISDDVIICDLSESDAEVMSEVTEASSRTCDPGDAEIVEVDLDSCTETELSTVDVRPTDAQRSNMSDSCTATCSAPTSSTITAGAPTSSTPTGGAPTVCAPTSSTPTAGAPTVCAPTSSTPTGGAPTVCAPTSSTPTCGVPTGGAPTSSALQLNKTSSLSLEDPLKLMDSILKENGAISQNINLLGKVELMDYLDSIDCSLEDFQAMVYGKQFGIDCDALEEMVSSKDHDVHINGEKTDEDKTDKQLIQYTTCPLLAFLDGCTLTPELDPGTSSTELCSASDGAETSLELLDSGLESKQLTHSSLIRLEPLTEAEASEETLFYLCELNPDEPEADFAQQGHQ